MLVASRVMSAGTVSTGGVTSRTVTLNPPVATLPAASVAVHTTCVAPTGNADPDGGAHATTGFGSRLSVALAEYVTVAVVPTASATRSPGRLSTGAVRSITIVNGADSDSWPAASSAPTRYVWLPS